MSTVGKRVGIWLRAVTAEDIQVFFAFQADPIASRMAEFPMREWDEHSAVWKRALADPTVVAFTIMLGDSVAGSVVSYMHGGDRLVGYWLGREFWGRGVATRALLGFFPLVPKGTLRARVAKSNVASRRVLEKCGFRLVGETWSRPREGFPEVDEWIFRLDDPVPTVGDRP